MSLDIRLEPDDVLSCVDLGRLRLHAMVHRAFVAADVGVAQESTVLPGWHVAIVGRTDVLVSSSDLGVDDEMREVVVSDRESRQESRSGK
jgi:hypothetical protein